jgi:hypothetical protein
MPMNSKSETPPEMKRASGLDIAPNRARQGVVGHNVRYVLLFGTVAVIVAFAVVYAVLI